MSEEKPGKDGRIYWLSKKGKRQLEMIQKFLKALEEGNLIIAFEEQLMQFAQNCIGEWLTGQNTKYMDYGEFIKEYMKPLIKEMFGSKEY